MFSFPMFLMTMTLENKEADWIVPCSDEESEGDEIPLPVVMLYKRIKERGLLELRVQECRKAKVDTLQAECGSVNMTVKESNTDERDSKSPLDDKAEVENVQQPKSVVTPSVFDYDDDNDDTGTCQLPRRTSKLGRLSRKRCATLQNVISDLKRFHDLDSKKEEVEQTELEKQPEQEISAAHVTEREAPVQDSSVSH